MLMERFQTSERLACAVAGLSRTVWRYQPQVRDDEAPFWAEIIRLACTYGRYGYRMIAGLMRNVGWQQATEDRVRRIWAEEGAGQTTPTWPPVAERRQLPAPATETS